MKDKSISRGYLRYTVVANKDTLVLQDLDLDIKKEKLKNFDKGEKISVIKIQERSICDSVINDKKVFINNLICPPVNNLKWDLFSKYFIFYEVEDSTYIRLYFINKKNPSDHIYPSEVVIQKEDSCLAFMAHYIARTLSRSHGKKSWE